MKKKSKTFNYIARYSHESFDRVTLTLIRNVGNYLYLEADKLLKAKPKADSWTWKASKK